MKNDELLHKWVNGTLTTEELEVFKLRPEYESLTELYRHTDDMTISAIDKDVMLKNILTKEKEISKPVQGRRLFLNSWVKYGIVVILLLIAGFFFLRGNDLVEYKMAKGEKTQEALPDGSMFVLNAESSLSYDAKKWESERTINLNGEAFFDVKKRSKFLVETTLGVVEVLGTEFNVRSRNSILEVQCKSGKVGVYAAYGKLLTELSANDAVRVVGNQIVDQWKTDSSTDWTNGMFKFTKVSVGTVLEELERQFNITIESNNINTKEIISCNFQNENLELALKTALGQLEIEYEIKNDKVILKK